MQSRLLRQSVIRGHRLNDATPSLFVVIDAVPHSSRRGQEDAHQKQNVVTAIAISGRYFFLASFKFWSIFFSLLLINLTEVRKLN